jgi:predicted ATPase/class 3 adenylate cyclase
VEAPESSLGWEQKLVAVLAIDLSFPMAAGIESLPYESWTVARRWEQAIEEKVQGFGGVLLQRATPPLLAAFGLPQTLDQLPQRAGQAALAIQQLVTEAQAEAGQKPVPEVRQALHLGPLLVAGQAHDVAAPAPVAGETLSVAVRLLGHAEPGEVLVSPQLGRLVTGWYTLRARQGPAGTSQPDQIGAYSIEGLVLQRAPQEGLGARTLSPFVGREREITLLRELLAQAQEGRGQVVGMVGEHGMGKSRLLYEFRQCLTGQRVTYLEGRCLSYGNTTPYLPVLDLLRAQCGITETDRAAAMVEKVHGSLQEVGMAPAEWAPYLLSLLGIQAETERLAAVPPETLKTQTFAALRQLSLYRSGQRPLILALEDLQWIDQTSEAFLASLVEKMGGAPLLLLATYRPEYRLPWLGKSYVTQHIVPPLAPQDSLRIVRTALQTEQVPDHLVRVILAKAEGNPFFLEEIAQALVERGVLVRGPATGAGFLPAPTVTPLVEIELPPTVQGVLATRIDRLTAETKALLQTLAVLGKECSWRLLTQVVDQPEAELQRRLTQLQAAELLYEQPDVLAPRYAFKHALTQDVAYASLPRERRREIHERVAQAIEALLPDRLEEHYSTLAHHYSRSGNTAKAVYYLQQAGQQAEQRSACAEAISHVTTALELLPSLPDTSERMQKELRLQAILGRALIATRGYAAPEVEHAYARALELCRQVGETSHLFQVLWGLRVCYTMRAEFQQARALAEEMLILAQHQHDTTLLPEAHYVLGNTVFYMGELDLARTHTEQSLALYDPQQHRALAPVYGVSDLRVRCLVFSMHFLVLLGYPDQALQRTSDALALAQELAHPFSLAVALHTAARLHQFRREAPRTQALAEATLALSRDQRFTSILAGATILRGWALAAQGQGVEGVAQMREGLAARRAARIEATETYFLALLAEGYGRSEQPEEGLTVLAEALAAVDKGGMRFYEAELYRLKGDLLRTQAGKGHEVHEAEVCFRQAIDIARCHQAKWLELRAALSLSRLWQHQGKRNAARQLLAEIYGWFTEGFETPDLREAKVLLTELA